MDNDAVGPVIAIFFMIAFYGGMMMLILGTWVVWIVALVDVVRREFKDPNDKLIWVLVICLTQGIGAIIYLVVGRQKGWLPGERAGVAPG